MQRVNAVEIGRVLEAPGNVINVPEDMTMRELYGSVKSRRDTLKQKYPQTNGYTMKLRNNGSASIWKSSVAKKDSLSKQSTHKQKK